jgi:hypothetical protein
MEAEIEARRASFEAKPGVAVWRLIGIPFNDMVTKEGGTNSQRGVPANRRSHGQADGFLIDG